MVDYARAMAAYKVGAEDGEPTSQWRIGFMYTQGQGVDVDYVQALPWIQKAAAQDHPAAIGQLGTMYYQAQGVTPSFCRSREYFKRAIELGDSQSVENLRDLTGAIQAVSRRQSNPSNPFITRA